MTVAKGLLYARSTTRSYLAGSVGSGARLRANPPADEAHLPELGEDARNRFDCKPQIVADVTARHREVDVIKPALPFSHVDEEGGDALSRVLSS